MENVNQYSHFLSLFSHISDTIIAFLQMMFACYYCFFFFCYVEIMDKGFTAYSELNNLVLAIAANITYLPANGPNMKWTS